MPPAKALGSRDVASCFHLSLREASKKLGVSETMLKKYCRRNGIQNWPFRVFRGIDAALKSLEFDQARKPREYARYEERIRMLKRNRTFLASHPWIIATCTHTGQYLTHDIESQSHTRKPSDASTSGSSYSEPNVVSSSPILPINLALELAPVTSPSTILGDDSSSMPKLMYSGSFELDKDEEEQEEEGYGSKPKVEMVSKAHEDAQLLMGVLLDIRKEQTEEEAK